MKRPAFQFYPGDWLRSADLRACSVGARGLWMDMLCLMHEGVPYGYLRTGKLKLEAPALSRLVGATPREVKSWLAELESTGVYSVDNTGCIYSRRMVRDENIREVRSQGGFSGAEHGSKGKEYGAKGGRPRGVIKPPSEPPLDTPEKPPLPPPLKPPPAFASASASASAVASALQGHNQPQGQPLSDPPKKRVDRPKPGKADPKDEDPPPSREAWNAYAEAYRQRYQVEPVRNASVNGQLANIVKRLGANEAPAIAAFYVCHNRRDYVAAKHGTNLLARDCEGLRTEWAMGRTVTDTEARQADRTQATGNVFNNLRRVGDGTNG